MLPFDRYLNLVYYWAVSRLDEKERKRFDRALAPRVTAESPVPEWWKGDADASATGLAAARALGINVDLSKVTPQTQGG